jgi:hypothetical protein
MPDYSGMTSGEQLLTLPVVGVLTNNQAYFIKTIFFVWVNPPFLSL